MWYNMWYNYWFQISWYAEKHTFTYYFTFENKGGIIFLPYFALKYTIPSTCKISTKINRTTYLTTPFVYFRYRRQLTRTPFSSDFPLQNIVSAYFSIDFVHAFITAISNMVDWVGSNQASENVNYTSDRFRWECPLG